MRTYLVLNGPNLDMLGVREPTVYGSNTLADLEELLREHAARRGVKVDCYQSNSEGKLVGKIHKARLKYDGIVYNPGAHTHYSYALRDAVGGIDIPTVEVHISDVDSREAFRHISVIAPACVAQVKGRGFQGYCDALDLLVDGVATQRLGEGYQSTHKPGQVILGGQPDEAGDAGSQAEGNAAGEGALLEAAGICKEQARQAEARASQSANAQETMADLSQAGASAARLTRLRAACQQEGMDAFLARDTSSIAWLTAFDGVFDEERAHALLVTPVNALMHTDSRYGDAAQAAAQKTGAPLVVDVERQSHAAFAARTLGLDAAGGEGSARQTVLGIEDSLALADYRALEKALGQEGARPALQETASFIQGLRAVKDAGEIARMRAAQRITDAAFSHIIAFMKPGMTEREVQLELEDFMVRHGAAGLAFPSIVACGANGASPHAIPGQAMLEAGQCVVMDFGARAYGYCSDMTRTVFLGQPSQRLRDAYEAIRQANEQVEALLKPGVTGKQAHQLAEDVLAQAGFAGKMGHGLGHGVGIDIHEEPVLAPRNDKPLVAGNVVTVEPGIYLTGEFGMRLEDFGVVTDRGFDVFTQSTHDMVII